MTKSLLSSSAELPFSDLDTELFMLMLEQHAKSPGLAVSVAAIQTRLSDRAKQVVTVEDVERIVKNTRYRQQHSTSSPYLTTHTTGVLGFLRLLDGVAQNSSRWGWNA